MNAEIHYDALCAYAGRLFFESRHHVERLTMENERLIQELQRERVRASELEAALREKGGA